ncbi:MAG: Mur ligase family protein [candidate division KSB1 bacterium]|nr:Mur ligase family protein [candidate division KSB1 bacterium]
MLNNKDIHKIYFLAVCGTGMASLAAMLKGKGYNVYGVDQDVYPPMSTFLKEQGIPVYSGWDPEHLKTDPDLVIVGNAVSRGNPELEALLNEHIPYMSLPDALREFCIRGHRSIVVTGTHGKTTTSSLVAWILEYAERSPNFMIGGIPNHFGRGFQIGTGNEFVVEGDEYDSAYFDKTAKFLHYLPDIGIITSIEFDHADIYDSLDDIKLAFRRFVNIIPSTGLLVVSHEDSHAMQISEFGFCPVVSFGLSSAADWHAADVSTNHEGTAFTVIKNNELWKRITIPMYGNHNVKNTLAAIITADHAGSC